MFGGMMLFWALLAIVFVVTLLRLMPGWSSRPASEGQPERPLEQLQHRYALGEITTEEYEKRKTTLERDGG